MKIEVIDIKWGSEDYQREFEIRNEVLRKPIGLDLKEDDLSSEPEGTHFGIKVDGELVGACFVTTVTPTLLHVNQVVVLETYRNLSLGTKLLHRIEKYAIEHSFKEIELEARKKAWNFYERLGYQFDGEEYLKFGLVWHRKMIKRV